MTNFPAKLHYLLGEMEKDGQSDIMSWQPNGRSFVVHDKARLEETILPHWFRQAKYSSFQRQLNIYGFQRISEGIDKGGYEHNFFRRDEPDLCANIPRCRKKGQKMRNGKLISEDNRSYPDDAVATESTQHPILAQHTGVSNELGLEFSSRHHESSSSSTSMYLSAICGLAHIQQVNSLCPSASAKSNGLLGPTDEISKVAAPIQDDDDSSDYISGP